MEDILEILGIRISVSIPTVEEIDGNNYAVAPEVLERRTKEIKKEMHEINFQELVKATAQSLADENFFSFRPIVQVVSND